jgi:hypothetical protein
MWAKSATALFVLALAAFAAAAPAAEAQDDSCKYAPRLRRLPACQVTYCAAGKTDPAFQARLFTIDDTLDRFAGLVFRAESDFELRRLTCRVLMADPTTAPLRRNPTRDFGDLYMTATSEPSLINGQMMADTVQDQDLFAPEAKTLASTYSDQQCAGQLSEVVGYLMKTIDAAGKRSDNFDCDKGQSPPANAPPRQMSCKDFMDTYKSLHDADDALKMLKECKTGCTEPMACRYPRLAKMRFQSGARELAANKARCAPQNPAFFAEAEKRAAEINALSKDATANCR